MLSVYDTLNKKYDIINLSKEDVIALNVALTSCPLPQKRRFYNLKKELDELLNNS